MQFYLAHGFGISNMPKRLESVQHRVKAVRGLRIPASGYGKDIPTEYMIKWEGRWYRVYAMQYSNCPTTYIKTKHAENGRIIVDIHN
jgi:hypothetical protein